MPKTANLPPVRVDPVILNDLERIASQTRPEPSVSALVRLAVVEFIERQKAGRDAVEAPF